MSATPYVTSAGLRIGCRYQSPVKPHHDADALKLQSALTGCTQPTDADGIVIVLGCILLALLIGAVLMTGNADFLWLLATTFF